MLSSLSGGNPMRCVCCHVQRAVRDVDQHAGEGAWRHGETYELQQWCSDAAANAVLHCCNSASAATSCGANLCVCCVQDCQLCCCLRAPGLVHYEGEGAARAQCVCVVISSVWVYTVCYCVCQGCVGSLSESRRRRTAEVLGQCLTHHVALCVGSHETIICGCPDEPGTSCAGRCTLLMLGTCQRQVCAGNAVLLDHSF